MTLRVVEIAEDGRFLHRQRGFMCVKADSAELGRIPLDDIACVIVTARGVSYSNGLLAALAERGAVLVICGYNFLPIAWLWPISGNHVQASRMDAQLETSKPFAKRAWQAVARAKIDQQAAILASLGGASANALHSMAKRVKSGDPDNLEAQAARRYWPELMGPDFRRDADAGGRNAMLNYGYAVLRATTARAIVSAGLHPTIGIHHRNIYNDMALADDLMEPFRPFVDLAVKRLLADGIDDVTPEAKQRLSNVMVWDLPTPAGISPLGSCIGRLATSLAQSLVDRTLNLALPQKVLPLEIG